MTVQFWFMVGSLIKKNIYLLCKALNLVDFWRLALLKALFYATMNESLCRRWQKRRLLKMVLYLISWATIFFFLFVENIYNLRTMRDILFSMEFYIPIYYRYSLLVFEIIMLKWGKCIFLMSKWKNIKFQMICT